MKHRDTIASRRRAHRPPRPHRRRRDRLQELVDSATRALAVLRAHGAAQHSDARSFGAVTGH